MRDSANEIERQVSRAVRGSLPDMLRHPYQPVPKGE